MKKLLLLSSMLFLGSCGNSDKTFKITTVGLAGKANEDRTLTINFASLDKVKHGALSVNGTFMIGTTACKFTATKVELTTASTVSSLNLKAELASIKSVSGDGDDDNSCKVEGIIKDLTIPEGAISLDVDGDTTKNDKFVNTATITVGAS